MEQQQNNELAELVRQLIERMDRLEKSFRRSRGQATHAGLKVKDAARRYRVGTDKIRRWIRTGELRAIDTATEGKSRYVIPPEALAAFEQARSAARPTPQPQRRPRKLQVKDYLSEN